MEKTVVGIFTDTHHAEEALEELQNAGIANSDISYAYATENKVVIEEGDGTKAGEGAVEGVGTGAILGGLAGLGVSDDEAKVYEKRIKSGAVLVATKTANPTLVKDIFSKHGVEEVNEYE